MFAVFGTNLGPASLVKVSSFPLPTELSGTSVSVTVGGTTLDCIMVFSFSSQLAAVLPSNTPTGDGTLTATYNGQSSSPISITVVAHSFGTFAVNTAGSGPGVLTNANNPLSVNTIFNAAMSGQMWDIWGTGLGAVQGDEAAMPLPGPLPYDVQVLVGGVAAQVVYVGRSGCCVGLDQIRFVVPTDTIGCYVPLTVVVEGVVSNFTTMAISESAGGCTDESKGIDPMVLSDAHARGNLRVGAIFGSRVRTTFSLPTGFPSQGSDFTQTGEIFAAFFEEFSVREAEASTIDPQGCYVYQFSADDGRELPDPIEARLLDAGSTMMLNPGSEVIPVEPDFSFFKFFNLPTLGFLKAAALRRGRGSKDQSPFPTGPPFYQDNTTYTADWPGGADVGSGSGTFETGTPMVWTNPTDTISRGSPFEVRWQGGVGDKVLIGGVSFLALDGEDEGVGAAFLCNVDRAPGSFVLPGQITGALPPSVTIEGIPTGSFSVASQMYTSCNASSLDICFSGFSDADFRSGIGYR